MLHIFGKRVKLRRTPNVAAEKDRTEILMLKSDQSCFAALRTCCYAKKECPAELLRVVDFSCSETTSTITQIKDVLNVTTFFLFHQ